MTLADLRCHLAHGHARSTPARSPGTAVESPRGAVRFRMPPFRNRQPLRQREVEARPHYGLSPRCRAAHGCKGHRHPRSEAEYNRLRPPGRWCWARSYRECDKGCLALPGTRERVVDPAFHEVRKVSASAQHLWRTPSRPFLLALNLRGARPLKPWRPTPIP
jgi:hypothetical protein